MLFTHMSSYSLAQDIEVGIDEHLGETVPIDTLTFNDEDGNPIILGELFDKPVVLTLVYFRCAGICTPLMQELTKVADQSDLVPGEDYRLITISFDPEDTCDMAKNKQANLINSMTNQQMEYDGWRFLTGDIENISKITDAVGFRYIPDKNEVDYVHAATLVFLTENGMIARYLSGIEFNPADLKLAVIDAKEGRARSFMQKIQRFCFSYDPDGHAYILKINRIILAVTLIFVVIFGVFFLIRSPKKRRTVSHVTGIVS